MNPKLQELIQNLLAGTRAGALKWSETPETGVYRLMLDKGLVRIFGVPWAGISSVGCVVLNPVGTVLHEVEVSRQGADPLIKLYDLVDGSFQETALDDLLAEVRMQVGSAE